jgi:putative peptide zinc metalloprotease protein
MENAHENGLWMDIQEIETTTPEEEPQGLWGLLQEKADQNLPLPCREGTGEGDGLWQSLQQRLNLSRRRPKRIAEYELAHLGVGSDHEYYVLKNPTAHTYVRCTPQDFSLWEMMDGRHSMRDLAVAYFAEFGSFPFERLVSLITQLGEAGFLEEKRVQVFNTLGQRLEGRSWTQRLNRWAGILMHHEFRFRLPDGFFDSLYRHGGWIFFSKVAQTLYIPLTLVGLILFLGQYYTSAYPLLNEGESWRGVLLLLLISYMVTPFHECAHGLACKHYGREVLGAGAMLYHGSLVFFVDTNDIWLAPKEARIVVSWAGPFSTTLIASVCSIVAALLPARSPIGSSFFKVALVCYLSALMNLNPLLEWDGYFILMDYLEIPRLRQKALGFLKRELPKRLARGWQTFSREELIFTVFGLLSTLWMVITFVLGLFFVRDNVNAMVQELGTGQNQVSIIVLSILVLLYGLPPVVGMVLKLTTSVIEGVERLFHRPSTV